MLKWFEADLHVHTVLSPCGNLLMGPRNIVEQALKIGLDFVAITDHNASENVAAVISAATGSELTVVPGMELTIQEEAHLICLFPELEHLAGFQRVVYEHLPPGQNDGDFFGPQYIVNEKNEVLDENPRLLILATDLSVNRALEIVQAHQGIAYPAHVDRKSYNLLNQLGFVPHNLKLPALEISWHGDVYQVFKKYPDASEYPFIRSSDAHEASELGRGTTSFLLAEKTFNELKQAILQQNGRTFKISEPAAALAIPA